MSRNNEGRRPFRCYIYTHANAKFGSVLMRVRVDVCLCVCGANYFILFVRVLSRCERVAPLFSVNNNAPRLLLVCVLLAHAADNWASINTYYSRAIMSETNNHTMMMSFFLFLLMLLNLERCHMLGF